MSILRKMKTPVFAAEGIPPMPATPDDWPLTVDGITRSGCSMKISDIGKLPHVSVDCRLTSVSGWSVRAEWNGILWRKFAEAFSPEPDATHVIFESAGGYTTTVPLSRLDHPRVLLCRGVSGEPIESEYGGPLRMVIPNLWGYKSCKWLVRITYTDKMIPGFWESRGYTIDGEIEAGFTVDINTGRRVGIPGGEVTGF